MFLLRFLLRGKKKDGETTDGAAGGTKYWAAAVVGIAAIVAVTFLVIRGMDTVSDATSTVLDKTTDAFRPKITVQTVISNAIGKIQEESKLVVMSVDLDVTIEKRSTKTVVWDLLNLGTTTVAFKARENRVQYVIPAESFTPESVSWDEGTKTLTITVPPPILDETIVEVQSDPDKCEIRTEVGWARFKGRSGKALEDAIRKELRPSVIEAGRHELLMNEASRKAVEAIQKFFMGFLKADGLDNGISVSVKCKE